MTPAPQPAPMSPCLAQAIAENDKAVKLHNAERQKAWNECDPYDLREIERSHKQK